jgi:valyl-tRNA synthetase
MNIPKRYNPKTAEPNLQDQWQESGVYCYDPEGEAPVYSIDTPPATVSGKLHMGHVYSYSHADFVARFWRMNGTGTTFFIRWVLTTTGCRLIGWWSGC